MIAEQRHHLVRLAFTQQAMIDKDTDQLLTNSFMDQDRCNRGINSARKPTNHLGRTDLLADLPDCLGAKRRHRPLTSATDDAMGKTAQQFRPMGTVHDLRMEHSTVIAALVIGDDGERCAAAAANNSKARRQLDHPIAMAHPNLFLVAGHPGIFAGPGKQLTSLGDIDLGAAKLALLGAFDPPAQLGAHGLLAIADTKNRQSRIEHDIRRPGGVALQHRGWSAGQNNPLGGKRLNPLWIDVKRQNFAINATFPHPARDQLGNLTTKVKDQDAVSHGRGGSG